MTIGSSKWLGSLSLLLACCAASAFAQTVTPKLLQIRRDVLKPGVEQEYGRIETDAAKLCVTMHCPNPYLAIVTIDDPREVWFLNGFESEQRAAQVQAAYQSNPSLGSALSDISARKASLLTVPPQNNLASWLPVLSGGPPWSMAEFHYLVITHTRGQPGAMGAVYAADDGSVFEIRPAATLEEAKAKFATGDPSARIFEIRPDWTVPDKAWVAADPKTWGQRTTAASH